MWFGITLLKRKATEYCKRNGSKTVLRMSSTYRCAVSVPLKTTKEGRLQTKWHPQTPLLRVSVACNSESRIGTLPWRLQAHLQGSSGHRGKRYSSLNTIRLQAA
ncbi:hypothetical protein TNCV_461091 [Trichonephila clavipes]|nr:hypothetical protein TNCV_461091 [Trichonephila clavipes]